MTVSSSAPQARPLPRRARPVPSAVDPGVPLNVNAAWNYFWARGQRRTPLDQN